MIRQLLPICVAASALALPLTASSADVPQELTLQNHVFSPAEVHVKAGTGAALHIRNLDDSAEEFDSDALKVEKVIAAHGEATLRLRPLKPGRYAFDGEYHEATAKGVVIAE